MSKQNRLTSAIRIGIVIFAFVASLSASALSISQHLVFASPRSQGSYPPLPNVNFTPPKKSNGTVSFRLEKLANSSSLTAPELAQQLSLPASGAGSLMRNAQGQVLVNIRMSNLGDVQLQALRKTGATIVHVSSTYQIVTAYIDITALGAISALPSVISIQEELQPLVNGNWQAAPPRPDTHPTTPNACPWGATRSEGDTQLKADQARSTYNLTGSGVKVGVLSDSYNQFSANGITAATDIASGDLPGPGNPCGYATPINVVMENPGSGGLDEGRAMLQIVHDLAPAATLSFATAGGGIYQFADNIRALRTAGADIIVDDAIYPDEPFFQDGPISVAVKEVVNAGALYFSSAGNHNVIVGNKNVASYEAPAYRPTTCPVTGMQGTCHDFDPTATVLSLSGFILAPGGGTLIDLQWAESWFGVTNDIDLYVFDQSGALVAYSAYDNVQTGMPLEFVSIQNTGSAAQVYYIVVNRYSGTGTPRLKYIFYGAYNLADVQVNTSSGGDIVGPTLMGHSASSSSLSVAAVPYNNSTTPEYFSSRGPAAHYYAPVLNGSPANPLPTPEMIQQPDFAATDGGCTTFFGSNSGGCYRFLGTSAAAPHAAAVAALLKERATQQGVTLTRALAKSTFQSTAQSMSGGDINSVGAGMLDARAAVAALGPAGPGAFSKSSPANGSTNISTSPTLTWGSSSGATGYEYCYDTTNDNACGGSWTSVGANASVSLSGLSNSVTYYWEVRAVNSSGTTLADNNTWWSFTTQSGTSQPPAAFSKSNPANGATKQVTTSLSLSWQSTSPVTRYEYCYSTTTGCANWTNVGNSTATTVSGLSASTTYYWQVRAWNGANGPTLANSGTDWAFTTTDGGTPPTGPRLSIPGNIPARYNATVVVPISFAANGRNIAATIFSIDFDQACLTFDPTDSDGDGVPNSVVFSVPAAFTTRSVTFEPGDTDGELDFMIMDSTVPLASLPDGQVASILFTATCRPTGSSIIAPVNFSTSPSATFGGTGGEGVSGSTANGSVVIRAGLPGDCNSDQNVNAGDLTALVLEIFDGDGDDPANTPNGTYHGDPIGCNPNGDQAVSAGDLSCTVLRIFNGPSACGGGVSAGLSYFSRLPERGAGLFSRAPNALPANPALTITHNITASPGSTVVAPIAYAGNGHDIASMVFSIDYDQTLLTLDPTDRNVDGIPDAIQLNVPAAFNNGTSVSYDVTDTDGEIDVVLADFTLPFGSLSDGTLVSITFHTANLTTTASAAVNFSTNPPVSLGNTQGQDVPGTIRNGSIIIQPTPVHKLFLPMIIRH